MTQLDEGSRQPAKRGWMDEPLDSLYDRRNSDAVGLLASKVAYVADFVRNRIRRRTWLAEGTYSVDEVRTRITEQSPGEVAITLSIEGVFAPAVLLTAGWWERDDDARVDDAPAFTDDLQNWLYTGFESWAPSWDFTSETSSDDGFMLGQIGVGDEANSLLVAVTSGQVEATRRLLEGRSFAFAASVTGLLCPRSTLDDVDPRVSRAVRTWGKSFDYCVVVDDDSHGIRPMSQRPPYYSGYLWQCWCPASALHKGQPPALQHCFFAWEHTDFTRPDAVDYNLDSLERKGEYLRSRLGDITLLQKSSRLVPGEPTLSSHDFRRLLARQTAATAGD